jgi:exonuclease SbcD
MTQWPFRFVHAADLHLEQTPYGISEVPETLYERFLEASYDAARRVFDTVLAEEAEWLVLSGDVLHPHRTGPRGPLFLVEQFERLAARNIEVYWAGGRVDPPEAWPVHIRLPANVRVFPAGAIGEILHHRDGVPMAKIVGASRARGQAVSLTDFHPDPGGLFTVGVIHGSAGPEALRARAIDYWALGGSHQRGTLYSAPHAAHYPGTPQGRHPGQTGPHGCSLVNVDAQRQIRITLVSCDEFRWQHERIRVDAETTRSDLEARMHERIRSLKETTPGIDLFLSWMIAGSGPLLAQARRGPLGAELLDAMRRNHGRVKPVAFSCSLAAEPTGAFPPEWFEQDTIRGDFLGEIRRLEMNRQLPISLESYLGDGETLQGLGPAAAAVDASQRERVLREASLLGVDLLSGEDAES